MPQNSLTFSLLLMIGAVMSVYVVFRYLDVSRVKNLDIETAMVQTKNVRCAVRWSSRSGENTGTISIGDTRAVVEYAHAREGQKSYFTSLLDRPTGDLYVWIPGETNVVHFVNALRRQEIDDKWWNTATLSNCTPIWFFEEASFDVPAGANITVR